MQTVVYNLCVGHNIQNAKLGIVNDEISNCSDSFYRQKCFLNDPNNTRLSCMFIDNLREHNDFLVNKFVCKKGVRQLKNIIFLSHCLQIHYPNLETGNAALNASHIWGLIYFTSNYTLALKNRINLLSSANSYDIDASSVRVALDPASNSDEYINIHIITFIFNLPNDGHCNFSFRLCHEIKNKERH